LTVPRSRADGRSAAVVTTCQECQCSRQEPGCSRQEPAQATALGGAALHVDGRPAGDPGGSTVGSASGGSVDQRGGSGSCPASMGKPSGRRCNGRRVSHHGGLVGIMPTNNLVEFQSHTESMQKHQARAIHISSPAKAAVTAASTRTWNHMNTSVVFGAASLDKASAVGPLPRGRGQLRTCAEPSLARLGANQGKLTPRVPRALEGQQKETPPKHPFGWLGGLDHQSPPSPPPLAKTALQAARG
jgi:hypothetical protein